MALIEPPPSIEFFAFGQKQGRYQRAERVSLCPVFGLVSALRLLSSSAVPSARVPKVYQFQSPSPNKGDISTLSNRGHFYFGLTSRLSLFFSPLSASF